MGCDSGGGTSTAMTGGGGMGVLPVGGSMAANGNNGGTGGVDAAVAVTPTGGVDAGLAPMGGTGGSDSLPDSGLALDSGVAADSGLEKDSGPVLVNECAAATSPCSANATCTDSPTSFSCVCKAGFTGDGVTCADIDECATNNGGCAADALCSNMPGARACACKTGFSGDGLTCEDINECATNNGGCDILATCTNSAGSFTCGNCPAGYSGGGSSGCMDINECTTNAANCSANAACTNGAGNFSCACNAGFTGNGVSCNACAVCGAGTFQSAACTATTETACGNCAAGCATCSDATTCNSCAAGFYLVGSSCVACTTCGAGQFQAAACSSSSNTSCSSCSTCGAGQYASAMCGGSSDTSCTACDAGCTSCTAGAGSCSVCSAGYALKDGNCVRAGASCLALHVAFPTLTDGVYAIDPDGAGSNAAFFAYCDMTNDGGGWMKILQYKDAAYTPTAAAVGTIAIAGTPAMAKLADTDVNSLATIGSTREYRFQGATSTKKLFIKSAVPWNDTARGEGLVLTGTTLACEATTNCAYVQVTTPGGRPTIDTNDWTPSSIGGANSLDRYFTDYSAPIHCYPTSDSTKRCYSSGASTNHALIQNLSVWARELVVTTDSLATYTLDENTGPSVGDTSGNSRNATVVSGSWTPGHSGSALLGSFRSNAAMPATTTVTVSVWARRDGTGVAYPRIMGWDNDGLELADAGSSGRLGVYLPSIGWKDTGKTFGSGFHHVAVTVGAGIVIVYYDGVQVYSVAGTANLSGKVSFGTRYNNVEPWVGAVDQARVFNRVLTAAEILALSQE
jgi:hypothetical protein